MFFSPGGGWNTDPGDTPTRGEIARRMMAAFLTWALRRQGDTDRPEPELPRIPVRRVDEGGFSDMTGTPEGRLQAERWWDAALARTPVSAPGVDAPSLAGRLARWLRPD